jgi:hypothetical protein
MCFNQRLYEWIGLLEHHPEMFWEYEGWEHNVSEYFFNGKDNSLKNISDRSDEIFNKRTDSIVKFIEKTRQLKMNFESINTNDGTDFQDMLQITSCGLLCGK